MNLKKRKKIIIIFASIIIIIILIIVLKPRVSLYEFSQVERKNIEQIVSASGIIKPSQEIDLQFETTGRARNIFVNVGDQVKVGQSLVKLNDSDLQVQYLQEQAALEAAQAKLDLLKAGSSPEEIQLAETEVKNYQTNLANIETTAENNLNVLYDLSKETMNDAYLKAHSMYNNEISNLFDDNDLSFLTQATQAGINVKNQYPWVKERIDQMNLYLIELKNTTTQDRIEDLLVVFKSDLSIMRDFLDILAEALNKSIGLSSTTLSTYKTNLDTARTNINTAISNLLDDQQDIITQKITNQTSINTAESNLTKAQDQLLIKQTGSRPEDIRYQEAQIKQQQAVLAGISEKINKTNLRAPIEGVITEINIEIGEAISTTQIAVSMNALGNFEIKLDIAEADIVKVVTGQEVKIIIDALPEEEFIGHVAEINPAETVVQGVVYYKSTVSFDQHDERIKAGMTASVDIVTSQKEKVLIIPLRALIEKNGSKFVRILNNGQIEEREIVVGISNTAGELEVISGLEEGEEIISFVKQK